MRRRRRREAFCRHDSRCARPAGPAGPTGSGPPPLAPAGAGAHLPARGARSRSLRNDWARDGPAGGSPLYPDGDHHRRNPDDWGGGGAVTTPPTPSRPPRGSPGRPPLTKHRPVYPSRGNGTLGLEQLFISFHFVALRQLLCAPTPHLLDIGRLPVFTQIAVLTLILSPFTSLPSAN